MKFAKLVALVCVGLFIWSEAAQAISINRCARLLRDQAGRETIANVCKSCLSVKVERQRPGTTVRGTPNIRDFTIPSGSKQPLPFRGPGTTRIMSEGECVPKNRQ